MQIISFLLLLIGIILFFYNKKSYLCYATLWVTFFPFLINFCFKIQTDSYYNLLAWCNYYNVIVFAVLFFTSIRKKAQMRDNNRTKEVLLVLFLMFVYSIFCAIFRDSDIILNIKYVFSNFSNVFFLLNIILVKPSFLFVKKCLNCVFLLELIVGFLQLFGLFHYQIKIDEGMMNLSIITGTFIRNNIYAEVLSLLFLSIFYIKVKEKCKINIGFWILTAYVFYIVYESGIRTALIAFVLVFCLLYVISIKKKPHFKLKVFFLVVSSVVVCSSDLKSVMSGELSYDSQVESSSERQSNLLNIFRDNDYLAEHTTIYYSIYVLSYFSENPIIGPGLLYSNGKEGYGGVVNISAGNLTDASLALYICETGIMGILLFFMLYYVILHRVNKDNIGAYLLFIFLLLITITDPGLFFLPNVMILFLLIYYDNFKKIHNEIN